MKPLIERPRISTQLSSLSADECLRRLAMEEIGHLAVVVDHYPQVFCVNYRLDDFVVVFRTRIGGRLLAANHHNVGFQVDHLDPVRRCGWSVLVRGMAEDVTDRDGDLTAERGRQLEIDPWVPGEYPRIMRIIPAKITGRELTTGDPDSLTDFPGYL